MPVSRKFSSHADLRQQAADMMGLDSKHVFVFPRRSDGVVLYVWTDGLSEAEVELLRSHKAEIKELACSFNGKIAMSALHPDEAERREAARRCRQGMKYRKRRLAKGRKPGSSFFSRFFPRFGGTVTGRTSSKSPLVSTPRLGSDRGFGAVKAPCSACGSLKATGEAWRNCDQC